jgi:tRNA dimethylallyltransferase
MTEPTEAHQRRPLVVIVGATASGKTELALRLAERFDGEIVNADSRQVFRGMDVGTAKPSADDLRRIPHHLINVVNPDETLGLQRYLDLAHVALNDIWGRGKLPFLVGGTGQYVWALVEGWRVPRVPPRPELRSALEAQAERDGLTTLYAQLEAIDPVAAGRVDRKNIRRLVRAIEVATTQGPSSGDAVRRSAPQWETRVFGIDVPRDELYRRIDERAEAMLYGGLLNEVRHLRQAGYGNAFAMTGIGYREVNAYLDGVRSLDAVTEKMKADTHRLARTQDGWFRRDDPRIKWLVPARAYEEAGSDIEALVAPLDAGSRRR